MIIFIISDDESTDEESADLYIANKDELTFLHSSCIFGSYELVKMLLDRGFDIHLKTKSGKNCLHIAAQYGHIDLCKRLTDKHNFDVHMADNQGWIALHFSVAKGCFELVKHFVNKGTHIGKKNNDGQNCLHIAAVCGHLSLCKILTDKYNFDVNTADNDGWTALHHSVRRGSYELVTFFANMGTDIQLKTKDGLNCLHIATLYGHLNLCKKLVDKHKFDVDIATNDGWTALHQSAADGSHEFVKLFADMGTDMQFKTKKGLNCLHIASGSGHLILCKILIDKYNFDVHTADNEGWTALHHSASNGSYKLFKYFVYMGSDIHIKTKVGKNCLHIAAIYGHLDLCKKLINEHGFDVNVADVYGWTILHDCAAYGSYELVKFFANTTDVHLKTKNGKDCLHIAAQEGHLNLCKIFIDKHNFDADMADNQGWTAFHHSTKNGKYELVNFFIYAGADIQCKTKHGRNCLHIAARNGHLSLCKNLIDKYNFDVNVADNGGWTAFHFSARNGSYELFKLFADMGASINMKSNEGWNCLHIAAKAGHVNLCKMLIERQNFNVYVTDNDGRTVLHHSAELGSYELVNFFVNKGADIQLKSKSGRNCLTIAAFHGHSDLCKKLIDRHEFDIGIADNYGFTALHNSAISGTYELVKFFIDMGSHINIKTNSGQNCLHFAADCGHLNLCKALVDKHEFNVHAVDNHGWTALHYSAKNGSYELFTYFANMEANIHLETKEAQNSLHIAAREGHLNLCRTLIKNHNFDVHKADHQGWTALHHSAANGSYELVELFAEWIRRKDNDGRNCLHIAANQGHLNLCKVLIKKHKFGVHITDNYGWTALHHSAESGSYELVKYFASKKADIQLRTNDGGNCLHIASVNGHLSLCKKLIDKHDFDVHLRNYYGWTALHFSAQNGSYDLVKYFTDKAIDIHMITYNRWNCLHIAALSGHLNLCKKLMENHNFDLHMATNEGLTPLHASAVSGSFDLFLYLLGNGSEIYRKTDNMENVLHFSASGGHLDICQFVLDYFTIDYKYNNSIKEYTLNGTFYRSQVFYKYDTIFLHAMDSDGNTYLHLAAEQNQGKVCELLLRNDTEIITLLNRKDETALEIAERYKHEEVLNVLRKEYQRAGMVF